MQSMALAAAARDALSMLMQAAPRQPDSGPKTLKRLWTLIGNISSQHVGVLSVYVVRGLMCVAHSWGGASPSGE